MMKKSVLIAVAFLVSSCSQKPEEVSETALPVSFPFGGSVSVERYNYGGAAGGYRYYVYGRRSNNERELLYKGKSNKLLSLLFPDNASVLLDFCGPTRQQQQTVTNLRKWRELSVRRLC